MTVLFRRKHHKDSYSKRNYATSCPVDVFIVQLFLLLFVITLTRPYVLAQQKRDSTFLPYGGERNYAQKGWYKAPALIFKKPVNFFGGQIDSGAAFNNAQFDSSASFRLAQFKNSADFYHAQFKCTAIFFRAHFDSSAFFYKAQFDSSAYFKLAQFKNSADFSDVQFKCSANFSWAQFDSGAVFNNTQFDSSAFFLNTKFLKTLSFANAVFTEQPVFENAVMKNNMDLAGVRFLEGVDLKRTNLDSVTTIYIDDHTFFPEGKFLARWDQIEGRFRLDPPWKVFTATQRASDSAKQANYYRLEIFYIRLRDNFKTQGDNIVADAVMHELGKHRAEILDEWPWKLYGWSLGWGYEAWRFLLFAVLPVLIIFSIIWYYFYYDIVVKIVDSNIEGKCPTLQFPTKEISLFKKGKIKIYNHQKLSIKINRLSRYWHVVFFSASVLLGIRIKKEWIQVYPPAESFGRRSFLRVLTLEWAIGIGLYIVFALLVKGSRFEFIKGLLGF